MRFKYFLLLLTMGCCFTSHGEERPNIILMLSDDQAWNGLSVPMHPELSWSKSSIIETPHLEKLAAQGMRFSSAYAPAPVCSPTRVSIQTGKSPAALHWTKAGPAERGRKMIEPTNIRQLDTKELTIAELLKNAGYATAHFGKWHLQGGGPVEHGYDVSDGNIGNEAAGKYKDPNPVDIFGMTSRATKFIEQSQKNNKPFFVQMSWNALHAPQNAMKETLEKYSDKMGLSVDHRQVGLAALAENLDSGVGLLVEAVDRLGLADNTYIIYMSDNGSGGKGRRARRNQQGSLSGGKGTLWEGGIRSPLIVRGPKIPQNSWCHERVVGYDLYPTFCAWAQIPESKLPDALEGGSIAKLLKDEQGKVTRPREEMVFHFPHYQQNEGPHSCLYLGSYKLIKFYEANRLALFDIEADPQEEHDLTSQLPSKLSELEALLVSYLNDIDAQMAFKNTEYDPEKKGSFRSNDRRRKPSMRGR